MKKYLTILLLCICSMASAQPSQVKKAAKNMFKLTTFAKDGTILHNGYGVFVGEDGTCLSNWSPFVGAYTANVIDVAGRKYDVDCLIGASEINDIAKFRVIVPQEKKMAITPIPVATAALSEGGKCWFAEYDTKNPVLTSYSPSKTETFASNLPYYIFEQTASETLSGSPFLNDAGELLGLMVPSKKRTDVYCPSAQFAMDFKVEGMTANEPTLRLSMIRVGLPADYQQAMLAMMLAGSKISMPSYLATAEEFISLFPTSCEGYSAKAQYYYANAQYAEADAAMNEGIEKSEAKDEAHYAYAKLIYNKVLFSRDSTYNAWTLDKVVEESNAAYAVNPQPIYTMQRAKAYYAMKKFKEAYDDFIAITKTNLREAEIFYFASICQQNMNADNAVITALLDSAVACFTEPYNAQAATYLLIRGKWLDQIGEPRKALPDFNAYEEVMKNNLNAQFYYLREQVELNGKMYQLALNDITKAIEMDPSDSSYRAEKALLLVRVNHLDEAITSADECIQQFPQYGDGYAIKGLALLLSKKKKEGLDMLDKAKELNSELADSFREKYGK